ncbi:hypothetical protein WA026_019331 [Henosepilachna vigintioctopunctata]|uniref:Uncharacterized protein n=1 Tax=Henosepilachna vigintioctopunctata TaxID=420089 RepID=A0AAW1U1G2_9CUCU
MHHLGSELDLPIIDPESDLTGDENFLLLGENSTWFHNIIDVMSTYCTFFKESGTLSLCSPQGPSTSLIRSRLHHLSSLNAGQNIVGNLEHAFPGIYPFDLIYEHRSYELVIPQIHQLMGEYSAINTSANYRTLNFWGDFNNQNSGRSGPYWIQNPSNLHTMEELALQEVEPIIADNYFVANPTSSK